MEIDRFNLYEPSFLRSMQSSGIVAFDNVQQVLTVDVLHQLRPFS